MNQEKTKISDIPAPELDKLVQNLIIETSKDYEQNLTPDNLTHMKDRTFNALRYKYNNLKWGFVLNAFSEGVSEKWGKSIKLTQKNIYSWLRHAKAELSTKPEESEPDMPMKEKLVCLYRMAEKRKEKTGKPNVFDNIFKRFAVRSKDIKANEYEKGYDKRIR